MPVYRNHRLVHIHIPKSGGTAIGSYFAALGDMHWDSECWVGQEYRSGRWYEYQHLTMQELLTFTGAEFEGFHSFAVLRNPYSRLLSDYYWRQSIRNGYPDAPLPAFDSVNDFVESIPDEIDSKWQELISESAKARSNFLIHVRPQSQYILNEKNQQQVHELLRFEQLDVDFAQLLGRYGLKTDTIRPPKEKDIASVFDRVTLDRVNRIYAKDFALGCYQML